MTLSTDRIRGLSSSTAIKMAVKCATNTNISLSGLSPVDGVALVEGDRVLVKHQTTAVDNGIWVASVGPWSRSIDFDDSREASQGTLVFVNSGLTNSDALFVLETPEPQIGVSSLSFIRAGFAASSPASVGLSIRQEFDTIQDLQASTNEDFVSGDQVGIVEGKMVLNYVGTSGGLIQNSASTPRHFNPVPGVLGIDMRAGGVLADSSTDYGSEINALLAYADSMGTDIFIEKGGLYRSDQTVRWKSCGIVTLGGTILTPPSGTYGKFVYNSDGVTEYADNTYCANDFAGTARTIIGRLTFLGAQGIPDWTYASRLLSNYNTAGVGGMTDVQANLVIAGLLTIQGFGDPVFVPTQEGGQATRALTRWKGSIRSRFCCTPFGRFGGGSNAVDDTDLFWRTDRCGGLRYEDPDNAGSFINKRRTEIRKGSLNTSIYARGLFAEDGRDAEPTTVTYSAGSATVTFSAVPAGVTANTWIVLEDAYIRSTDSTPINLVCKVQSIASNVATLYTGTHNLPNTSGSGKAWYYEPPEVQLASSAKINSLTSYFEDQWNQIDLRDVCAFVSSNFKIGGTSMSGRNGALINTTGLSGYIHLKLEQTTNDSEQLEALVGIGTIRKTSTGVDSSYHVEILSQEPKSTAESKVKMVKAVDPLEYFATDRNSRWGYTLNGPHIEKRFSDGVEYGTLVKVTGSPNTTAYAEQKTERSGTVISGSQQVIPPARVNGVIFVKALTGGVPETLVTFGSATYPATGKYVLDVAASSTEVARLEAHIFATSSGYHIETLYSNRITVAMSGNDLQITDTAGGVTVQAGLRKVT